MKVTYINISLTLFEAFWFSLFEDVERPEFSLFDMELLAVMLEFDPPPQGESTMRELKTPGATGEGRTSSEQVGLPLPKFTTPEGKWPKETFPE